MAAVFPTNQVIVVGGGLAGVSAGNTAIEHGCKVVLLDKSAFCGGNSTKATSGINGANTKAQKEKNVQDSIELFTQDTLKGGAKKPELVKVLCGNSGEDVEWLMDAFDLDLSLVARLGGHSAPRTHRGKERFPGMTITYALIQSLEQIAERTDLLELSPRHT
jgi:succinate dehydrogenase/fumarate reductase flavoprotein subunit